MSDKKESKFAKLKRRDTERTTHKEIIKDKKEATTIVSLVVTKEEKEQLKKAAKDDERSVTKFLVKHLYKTGVLTK